MEFTGKVVGISQDYSTGAYTISFRVNEAERILHGYDGIKDVEKLAVSVKKWRKKRSLCHWAECCCYTPCFWWEQKGGK